MIIQRPVMPGLVPGIHAHDDGATVDGRDKPGHDGGDVVTERQDRS